MDTIMGIARQPRGVDRRNGCFSQGHTRAETRANVIDALRLMLSPEPAGEPDRREREQLHLTIAA